MEFTNDHFDLCLGCTSTILTFAFISFQILNDVNGNLDAKKACAGALKLHKKYLKKVTCYPIANQVPAIMLASTTSLHEGCNKCRYM